MASVWFRLRTEARAHWRAWLAIATLTGLVAGLALGALAGARRTDSAYPRFLRHERAYDVVVGQGIPGTFDFADLDLSKVAHLPQVAEWSRVRAFSPLGRAPDGTLLNGGTVNMIASPDGRFGSDFNRSRVLRGRAANPRAADEIEVSFVAAQRFGFHVGDTLPVSVPSQSAFTRLARSSGRGQEFTLPPPEIDLRVVGITAAPGEFPPISESADQLPYIHLTPAFAKRFRDRGAVDTVAVRLRHGSADFPAFARSVASLSGGKPGLMFVQDQATTTTERSIHVQANALRLVALLVALAGALVVVEALIRQATSEADDRRTLRALGATSGQLWWVLMIRTAVIGLVSAGVSVGVAVALSPLAPIGVARNAEVDPGIRVDGLVVGLGFVAIVVLVLAAGALAAWRALSIERRTSESRRPSRLANVLGSLRSSAPVAAGTNMAFESGRGATVAPARAAMSGAALAIALVVGAAVFWASLSHLLETPRLYGWNWNAQIGDVFAPDVPDTTIRALQADPALTEISAGTLANVNVNGVSTQATAVDPLKGSIAPSLLRGTTANGPDEIVLGPHTASRAHVGIGDTVTVAFGRHVAKMRVVGIGILPDTSGAGLGRGAFMTFGGLHAIAPNSGRSLVLIRTDADHAVRLSSLPGGSRSYRPEPPTDLAGFHHLGAMPGVVGGVLSLAAFVALGQAFLLAVRRRRRDLAVLKSLGFVGRQLSATILWQATTVAVLGLAVGIPIGLMSGIWTWRLFTDQLPVLNRPAPPVFLLVLLVPAVVVALNLVALWPARAASRTKAATVLRSE